MRTPRKWVIAGLLTVLMLVAAPSAYANIRLEGGGDVPFYARIGSGEIYHTADVAVIVFYRPPECIPTNFNLLDFFDIPGAFECTPPTTDGFSIWRNGPDVDFAPIQVNLHGLGAVPVWFVSWPELQAATADNVLTIGELEALPSLVEGSASSYQEVLHPSEAARMSMIEFNARGTLEDGRSFQVQVTSTDGAGRVTHVRINFG